MLKLIFKKKSYGKSPPELAAALQLSQEDSPISLYYQGPGPYIAKIPKESCRSNFFGWHASENPFVKTILESSKTHTESTLLKFYSHHQYINTGELFKIKESPISSAPAMAAVMPWWNLTPKERLKSIAILTASGRFLGKEAVEFGASTAKDYGWQYFGPISNPIIEIEFKRQISVYNSIKQHGYKPDSPLCVHGEFLVAADRWCWVNQGGKHRFNSLIALNHDQITVSAIGKYGPFIVRPEDAKHWPNVKNGNFTEKEAIELFYRILDGRVLEIN